MKNDDFPFLTQAAIRANQNRIDTRSIQALMGICSGLVADDNLNDKEIYYLRGWLLEHQSIRDQWPVSVIHFKIQEILADGVITNEERQSLVLRLQELTGNFFSDTGSAATEGQVLPLDDDPSIFFNGMSYCFTGEFLYGTRAACERVILKLGAMPQDNVTKKLNYLVIGSRCNPDWINESYGRKIEAAMNHKSSGLDICIISERQWTAALQDAHR